MTRVKIRPLSRRAFAAGLTAATVMSRRAVAQGAYPNKPVTMVISFAAGGTTDIQGRVLANALASELGQPVPVVNRPGAGGATAASQLVTAPADGYTLMFGTSTTVSFVPLVSQVNYDLESFTYIAAVARGQQAIVVNGDSPIRSFQELIALARTRSVTYATQTHVDRLIMQAIARQSGANIRIVPTQGGGGMVPMLLGNQIDCAFSGGIHATYTQSGQMRVIAAMTEERLKAYPEVPSLRELGFNFATEEVRLIVGPRGLPADILRHLEAAIRKAAGHPEFIEVTEQKLQFPIIFMSSQEAALDTRRQRDSYANLVRVAGQ
jgi:tripartite-type tricarboxylate transporter receptor subunit TctC